MYRITRMIFLTGIASLYFLLAGCAQTIPKIQAYPEMYNEKPASILILPAVNNSTAADAPELYSSTITEPLANSGFYVLPLEVTDRFLKNEGFSDGAQLMQVPAQKFGALFGADAVLYVTIQKWDTNYWGLGGNVTVAIDYDLKSTKTGGTLWRYNQEQVVDTGGGNNGGGLLGALISTALNTAMQDYVPVARNVNMIALRNIPYGKYHKAHGQDGQAPIPKQKVVDEE